MQNTLDPKEITRIVSLMLSEDVGTGDLTSAATIPADARLRAVINARDPLTLAGMPIAEAVFRSCDPDCRFDALTQDGDRLAAGACIARIEGNARALLTAERSALNMIQHLSGIATLTQSYADRIAHTKARLLDTRKTIPGLRVLAKYAVTMGGGYNHRMRLDDGVLIKDNHIAAVGSVDAAIKAARAHDTQASQFGIAVECDTLAQVKDALAAGADRLLLDNMSNDLLRQAVAMVGGRIPLEASGGVNLDTIGGIAETGVDYISVGRITQSAPAVDIGLDYE
ncbi:carboxylating nicotinate-nucleotide diphosphorylase [Govanella unica]|uniref:Probable nicotinate-nucleotide pyrophosphorylase [carboxylating] n=1 Tax=Govanella unica TaxID=2975056 RepID=A0A9X3TYI4_9PROT|nr:carboxylating nicotinate-nucleotide diphosphorylase [Govania unica]MDA5194050.1 carboxylating nicotinate-nucleotide diphosphorylase [Govania unica]